MHIIIYHKKSTEGIIKKICDANAKHLNENQLVLVTSEYLPLALDKAYYVKLEAIAGQKAIIHRISLSNTDSMVVPYSYTAQLEEKWSGEVEDGDPAAIEE